MQVGRQRDFAVRAADERETDGRAKHGALARRFRNLKLHLERGELADAEAFLLLPDGLALANVTPDDDSGEGSLEARLIDLNFELMNGRVAAFDERFPAVHVVFSGFGFELGGVEISLRGEAEIVQLLLAA